MASSATLFLIALILFATANPLAHAQLLNLPIGGIHVNGSLCCTPTGNCPPGVTSAPLSGVNVRLTCTTIGGATVQVGQSTTSANGVFNITIRNIFTILGFVLSPTNTPPCVANVQLPLSQTVCPLLSNVTGTLVGAVQLLGTTVGGLLGAVQSATVPIFVTVALS